METIEETEDRIARTLAAVAEQTTAEAGQPPVIGNPADNVVPVSPRRSPKTMLVAVAAATVAVVGVGLGAMAISANNTVDTAATGTDSDVSTTSTAAPEPDVTVVELTGEPPAAGQPLRLILPEGYLPSDGVESAVGEPGSIDSEGPAIVVGRRNDAVIEEPVTIYLTQNTGGFAVEEGSDTEIAGRTILNSHDEGVVEQVDGQRWIVYQTEFDDQKLEQLVQGTSVEGDRLIFSSDGPFEELARQESIDPATVTTVFGEVTAGEQTVTVALQTMSAAGAELPLISVLSWWTPTVEQIEIGGRPAYISTMDEPGEGAGGPGVITTIGWQPSEFHTAAALFAGVSADEAIAIVEGMLSVDADSWDAYWS